MVIKYQIGDGPGKKAYVLLDEEDIEVVGQFNWNKNKYGYAYRQKYLRLEGEKRIRKGIMMHRLIINAPEDKEVDHIDGNRLNNTKINLRLCSPAENSKNKKKYSGYSNKYKGVSKSGNKWTSRITNNGESIYLGIHDNEVSAALAYNVAANIYHGEFARLNIIEGS